MQKQKISLFDNLISLNLSCLAPFIASIIGVIFAINNQFSFQYLFFSTILFMIGIFYLIIERSLFKTYSIRTYKKLLFLYINKEKLIYLFVEEYKKNLLANKCTEEQCSKLTNDIRYLRNQIEELEFFETNNKEIQKEAYKHNVQVIALLSIKDFIVRKLGLESYKKIANALQKA